MNERQDPESVDSRHDPKPLTLRQNVILTVKVLAGAATLVALLWFVNDAVIP